MKRDKLAFQVKFWALIGPFVCLLALFVFFVKSTSGPIFLPVLLLVGVPLCWRWKLWGVAFSVGLLFAFLTYTYGEIPLEERFWYLGMGVSIALALFITALSFDEVEAIIFAIQLESRSRLENLWKVDEKQKYAEEDLKKKRESVREFQIKIRSYQKLVDLSAVELYEAKKKTEGVLEELYQTKMEAEQLKGRLEEVQHDPPAEAKYLQLRGQFAEKSAVLEKTRRELFLMKEKVYILERELEEAQLYQLSEVEGALERHLIRMEEERVEDEEKHQQELDALHEMVSVILAERD